MNLALELEEVEKQVSALISENIEYKKQLVKAKDLLLRLSVCLEGHSNNNFEYELIKKAEQFLKDN